MAGGRWAGWENATTEVTPCSSLNSVETRSRTLTASRSATRASLFPSILSCLSLFSVCTYCSPLLSCLYLFLLRNIPRDVNMSPHGGETSISHRYNTGEFQCSKYGGPWVAWAVVRANAMDGISLAARNVSAGTGRSPNCARVTIVGTTGPTGTTSDIVAEQNQFGCPAGGNGTIQYSCYECTHSVRRP
eukprot:m.37761 g.37761  ORF g.37761 m.37761 type:complete len:189 (-) comp7733_c0_seq2:50-616(-)